MSLVVDCYLSPQSPWSYLGHARLLAIADAAGAHVDMWPVDLGQVFPASGGVPLAKRAPQRQAYRLVELQRFASHLGLPLNLKPKFFPVAGDAALRLLAVVKHADGSAAALELAGVMLRGVWADERNLGDATDLAAMLDAARLPAERLPESDGAEVLQRTAAATQRAIDAGVFGAPSYVVDGEIFWGQDRLDFLQRRLARG
jgi:2-hydroxychromene-2-carboxylate isomerase